MMQATAKKVITVEHDLHVLQVQLLNPWSHALEKQNIELLKRYEQHASKYYDRFGR